MFNLPIIDRSDRQANQPNLIRATGVIAIIASPKLGSAHRHR